MKTFCTRLTSLSAGALSLLAATLTHADTAAADVITTYGDIAEAAYGDALTTAKELDAAIAALLDSPNPQTLNAARDSWREARVPYQQTEAYRFGNPIVDDWEGRVNAWPLDEGLIDYVDASYGQDSEENVLYAANIIANPNVIVNGAPVDAGSITPELLQETLHEAEGAETNVATGYHAIEFLLWGQDLNGSEAGAGDRPATDFDVDNCTGGSCDRRGEYLQAASTLLISDLAEMVDAWQTDGAARRALTDMGEEGAIAAMLTGLGSLSYGELAGERMQLGLMLHDPEEEHDCFADNTAASHYYDGVGIQNVFEGRYTRVDGSEVSGPSLRELVAARDPAVADELSRDIATSVERLEVLLTSQNNGRAYDQLIAAGDTEGNALVQEAIDALIVQTRGIERAVAALELDGVTVEGSDSLDNPTDVF